LRLGELFQGDKKIDSDSHNRILQCVQVLMHQETKVDDVFLHSCNENFSHMLERKRNEMQAVEKDEETFSSQPDDLLVLRQLRGRVQLGEIDLEGEDEDLDKAVGSKEKNEFVSRLDRICQLTGYSDPIYAEACVTVHDFDILLEILIINQTEHTLQNLSVELYTSGDLKLVERPQAHTLAPYTYISIQANIKVSSTESGVIFGNISYDIASTSSKEKNIVVMNSIHMDIVDYIAPAFCTLTDFRKMWAEFEWENKIV